MGNPYHNHEQTRVNNLVHNPIHPHPHSPKSKAARKFDASRRPRSCAQSFDDRNDPLLLLAWQILNFTTRPGVNLNGVSHAITPDRALVPTAEPTCDGDL